MSKLKRNYWQEIQDYCSGHKLDFKSFIKVINEPKVVPMIRGIGYEYVVTNDLRDRFLNTERYEINKPIINAQLGIPDIDIEIYDNKKERSIKIECKLSKINSFRAKGRLSPYPHCQIKVMRSRTLGEKTIQVVSRYENVDPELLRQHKDSYIYTHFDFVITNLRNAFYRTIDEAFVYSPSEPELHFLGNYFNTNNHEEIDNLLGKNHFFIESKYLVAKFTNTECRKKVCSNRSNCFFVPNYPIFTFEENEYWKPIDEFEDYLNIHF